MLFVTRITTQGALQPPERFANLPIVLPTTTRIAASGSERSRTPRYAEDFHDSALVAAVCRRARYAIAARAGCSAPRWLSSDSDPVLRAHDLAYPRDRQTLHPPRFPAPFRRDWLLTIALTRSTNFWLPRIQPWYASVHGDPGGSNSPAVTYRR